MRKIRFGRRQDVLFKKSSFSAGQGQCVEVGRDGDTVLLRDSKNLRRAPHQFTPAEMTAFIKGVKAGEFDEFMN